MTGANGTERGSEDFVHVAAEAFHLRFIQIMMKNTVIDMAKVRFGSVVGTALR